MAGRTERERKKAGGRKRGQSMEEGRRRRKRQKKGPNDPFLPVRLPHPVSFTSQ